jgi:hypothetical protein
VKYRDAEDGVVVLMELVTELAHAAIVGGSEAKKRKAAVAETKCETPRLRPRAVRKRGSEVSEAKQVDALADVGLYLWKHIRGKR